jgi:alpha-beta hydrolase superfamily lysophospholipase
VSDAVGAPTTSTIDHGRSRDGVVLLRRRWRPRAAVSGADPIAAVLLVHGIGEHSGRYEHVGTALAAAGFDTVAIDQRGHGQSGGRRGHVDHFDDFIDDVHDQLVELRALGRPVVLFGHSMGGLIALSHVLQRREAGPDLLVLSAPALAAGAAADRVRPLVRLLGGTLTNLRVPNSIEVDTLSSDPVAHDHYRSDPLIATSGTLGLVRNVFDQMDWANAHLHRLDVPTLVLHGSDDTLVPTRSSEPLDALPGVTRWVEPGLRHELLNERPWPSILARIVAWIRTDSL